MRRMEIWPAHSEAQEAIATLRFDEPPAPGQKVEIAGDIWVITETEQHRAYVQPHPQA